MDDFEFHFHIHQKEGVTHLGVGSCDYRYKRKGHVGEDKLSWGLRGNGCPYNDRKALPKIHSLRFRNDDLVKFRVQKKEKKVLAALNTSKEFVVIHENVDFPEHLRILGSAANQGTEFELVYFKDHSKPSGQKLKK